MTPARRAAQCEARRARGSSHIEAVSRCLQRITRRRSACSAPARDAQRDAESSTIGARARVRRWSRACVTPVRERAGAMHGYAGIVPGAATCLRVPALRVRAARERHPCFGFGSGVSFRSSTP